MQPAHVGPRVLLRRLREVMAGPEAAQTRLNKITTLIASNMVAEVCSIYVMRPGGFLELYATEGLNPDALHETKLRVGEGRRAIGDHDGNADKGHHFSADRVALAHSDTCLSVA